MLLFDYQNNCCWNWTSCLKFRLTTLKNRSTYIQEGKVFIQDKHLYISNSNNHTDDHPAQTYLVFYSYYITCICIWFVGLWSGKNNNLLVYWFVPKTTAQCVYTLIYTLKHLTHNYSPLSSSLRSIPPHLKQ